MIESFTCSFDRYQNERLWMNLNGCTAFYEFTTVMMRLSELDMKI